jgi:hypothetical protein
MKTCSLIIMCVITAMSFANAQVQKRLLWGLGVHGGINTFINIYDYDKSFYHFPITSQFQSGGSMRWALTRIDHLYIETTVGMGSTKFNAEKYNNSWTATTLNQYRWNLASGYRMDISRKSPMWLQFGLRMAYTFYSDIQTEKSQHSNDNNVRDILMALYMGKAQKVAVGMNVHVGYYLDKKKTHEVSLSLGIPAHTLFRKKDTGMMKHSFTFADRTSAVYEAAINGFSIPFGIQYMLWF